MDLIDRQAAIKAVEDLPNCYNGYSDTYDKSCIIGLLEELPSAQPEPIKINIDHELTKEEYEKLRKDMADAPIVLLPSAQPEERTEERTKTHACDCISRQAAIDALENTKEVAR